jgi:tenascin
MACDVGECPTNDPLMVCSSHGDCIDGQCQCDDRFVGPDCGADACPMGCIYGTCTEEGKCLCDHGFRGTDCSISGCPGHCNGNGMCSGAICFCSPGFTGDDCSALSCFDASKKSSQHFASSSATSPTSPTVDSCSGHGTCTTGRCKCDAPFGGYDCSYKTCTHLDECNGNGYCHAGECICYARYGGASCATKLCPHNCGGNAGTCSDGVCICSDGTYSFFFINVLLIFIVSSFKIFTHLKCIHFFFFPLIKVGVVSIV